jgi:hypothetical protein
VCRQVTECKTVTKKCGHWEEEQYCVPGKTKRVWSKTCDECCFDPCTCSTHVKKGHWTCCKVQCPDEVRCRKVWKCETRCEVVPCTRTIKECVHEKVPYTVCKKVPITTHKQVPYTVCTMTHETIVKKVPYTVTTMHTEVIRRQVPYQVTRRCMGAWVDTAAASGTPGSAGAGHGSEGCATGYECPGPGRTFQCGAYATRTWTTTSTRMVQEVVRKQVPYTVYRTVTEECVKTVPYTVCKMVPHTVKKLVPYTVCEMHQETIVKKVPYTTCTTVPYTVHYKVPYTVTECVPVTVCKQVAVQVCKEVPVRVCRKVPCECPPACEAPCKPMCCESSCCNPCCECKESFLKRIFHRRACCNDCCNPCCDPCSNPCGSSSGGGCH